MKIAGEGRRNRPHCLCWRDLQKYSTRGWVYREGQGWLFADFTPEEQAEFQSYPCDITIPRMRARLPYAQAIWFLLENVNILANWFAYCTLSQADHLTQTRFRLQLVTGDKPMSRIRHPVEPGSYAGWLWADEVAICRAQGCEVSVHGGWGWCEWGVPAEWKPPLLYKERVSIYAFVNELTREVYVGQTEYLERRQAEHLRDTENIDKLALIQSLRAQDRQTKPIELEEVAGEKATERERYWTSYYKSQGYKIINRDYRSLI